MSPRSVSPRRRQGLRRVLTPVVVVLAATANVSGAAGAALAHAQTRADASGGDAPTGPPTAVIQNGPVSVGGSAPAPKPAPRPAPAPKPAPAPRPAPKPAPAPAPQRIFGLSDDGADAGLSAAESSAGSLDRHLDVVNFYVGWSAQDGLPVDELRRIAAAGARPEITWEPWDYTRGVNQPGFSLRNIANGAYDGYIRSWAQQSAAYQQPIMLRFAHEMNGSWYPWAAGVNGNVPSDYVAAYRHVHDLFEAAGATNVSWVWCPNSEGDNPGLVTQLYPGAGYVDYLGVDGYNGGTAIPSMGGWRSPQQIFDRTLRTLHDLAPTTPIVLNEVGSSESGGSKSAWITTLFQYLSANRQVTGVIWFDYNKETDWQFASSSGSLDAARAALARW